MKITKSQLKQIIKEELKDVLNEEDLQEKWWHAPALALGLGAGVAGTAAGVGAGIGAAKDAIEDYRQDRADSQAASLEELEAKWKEQSDKIYDITIQLEDESLDSSQRQSLERELQTAQSYLDAIKRAHAGRS
jgi:Na+/phosphate symporter